MKKIVGLSLVLLMIISIMGNVYAASLTCNVNMKTEKTEYNKGDEFTVEVNLSNIQSDKGVVAFGATLEYDKDSLTMVEMRGKDQWSNPSYNETKGKLVVDRNGYATSDETIFYIKFKVKDQSKKNLVVTLKDVTVSSGSGIVDIENMYKNITIKEDTIIPNPNPDQKPNTNTPTGNTNSTPTGNTNKNTADQSTGKLPQTGNDNTVLVAVILGTIVAATVFYVKIRKINK